MSEICVSVLGASGYAGAEFLRLAANHPYFRVTSAVAHSQANKEIREVYPGLGAAYGAMRYLSMEEWDGSADEVVVLALPHGESQRVVPELLGRNQLIVDLGADFRLDADTYEAWYGETHSLPAEIDRFSYGLVELCRENIQSKVHVAAPGCYPTATALAIAPALQAGAIEPSLTVNALSGVSGAGRSLKTELLFGEVNENARAYGVTNHRHTGEMEFVLGQLAGTPVSVLFTPHLIPMTRGILVTATAPVRGSLTSEALLNIYREYYANESAVMVTDAPPQTKAVLGANMAQVSVAVSERTNTVVMMAAIDNLTKGTAGQAIQALNLKFGFDEGTGLTSTGFVP